MLLVKKFVVGGRIRFFIRDAVAVSLGRKVSNYLHRSVAGVSWVSTEMKAEFMLDSSVIHNRVEEYRIIFTYRMYIDTYLLRAQGTYIHTYHTKKKVSYVSRRKLL